MREHLWLVTALQIKEAYEDFKEEHLLQKLPPLDMDNIEEIEFMSRYYGETLRDMLLKITGFYKDHINKKGIICQTS